LILDFDGVVILSNDIKDEAFRAIFSRRFPTRVSDLMSYHLVHNAIPRREKFHHVVHEMLRDPGGEVLVEDLTREFEKLTRQALIDCAYGNGALEFLEFWTGRLPVYLSSATPQADLDLVIDGRGLRKYFRGVFGAPEKKPKVIRGILAELRIPEAACLFVGDSPEDLHAAKEVSVPFAGIHGKSDSKTEPVPNFPDLAGLDRALR